MMDYLPVNGLPEPDDDRVCVVVAPSVFCVVPPVRHVQLGRACDHQF